MTLRNIRAAAKRSARADADLCEVKRALAELQRLSVVYGCVNLAHAVARYVKPRSRSRMLLKERRNVRELQGLPRE
jgi:hypothetical protein